MLSCEYKKDFSHSYLILVGEIQQENTYEANIMIKNNMKGLLGCQIRHINSQMKYFYDITSKQSLESVFAVREIEYEDMKNLFLMLKTALDEVKKFLLDGSDMVLGPSNIYVELETNQIWFVYYPGYQKDMQEALQELSEYLLNKINHKDSGAVNFTYWLYDYIHREQFSVLKIMEYFEVEKRDVKLTKEEEKQEVEEKEETVIVDEDSEMSMAQKTEFKTMKFKKQLFISIIKYLLVPVLCELVIAIILFQSFEMSVKETALLFGFYGLICTGCGIIIYIKNLKNIKEDSSEIEGESQVQTVQQEGFTETLSEPDCFGETTFLGSMEAERKNLLAGIIKGKEIFIEMKDFPFVIGKMKESVNFVLHDTSISRMHAKLFRKDESDKIYIMDLNSTNGTGKNGVPLEVNEEVELSPGDEIQLGRLTFTYH